MSRREPAVVAGMLALAAVVVAVAMPAVVASDPASDRAPTVKLTPDRTTLALSESVTATLTVEGPAPLRVELPSPLLEPESEQRWRIRPVAPPTVTPAGVGCETWTQRFRLDPYTPGELYAVLAPLIVNGQELSGPGFAAKVTTRVAEPRAESARPVTGIEELPEPTDDGGTSRTPWVVAGATAVAVGLVVALMLVSRLRRKPAAVPPHEWATAALDELERGGPTGARLAEGLTAILRGFLERQYGIAAGRLTTAELQAAAEQATGSIEQAGTLRRLLDGLDRIRFGGKVADDARCRGLAAAVRDWVNQVSTAGPRPG